MAGRSATGVPRRRSRRWRTGRRARDPGEVGDVELLAAGGRVDPRRAQHLLGRGGAAGPARPAPPAASCAAGRTRRPPRRTPRPGSRSWPAAPGASARPARSPRSGTGQNTVRPTEPARRTSPYQRGLDRRDAVRARPRWGGEPLGHLGLHHHQNPAHRRQHVQQVQQHGHRDVVRQVRDQRGRRCAVPDTTSAACTCSASAATTVSRSTYAGARSATVAGSSAANLSSTSTATTADAAGSRPERQRPEPRSHLEHDVAGPDGGRADDPAHGVRVDDEVLPALLGRATGPARAASARTSAGPSSATSEDGVTTSEVAPAVRPRTRAALDVEQLRAVRLLGSTTRRPGCRPRPRRATRRA